MRRISPGTVTVAFIAIVLGLVAVYMWKKSRERPVVEAPLGVPVVVSRINLPNRAQISLDNLEVRRVPRDQVSDDYPEGYITEPAIAAGRMVKQTLRAGDPVPEDALYPIGHTLTLIKERLKPGHRAVTIQVDGTISSQRFISPETFVDISVTVEGEHPNLGSSSIKHIGTTTLLRSVEVLGVVPGPSRRGTESMKLVVSVPLADAKRLILAEKIGKLNVTVVGDEEQVTGSDIDEFDTLVNPDQLLGLKVPDPEPTRTVEVYRGSSRSVLTFGPDKIREADESSRPQVPDVAEPVNGA